MAGELLFLSGGNETGALIRSIDWSTRPFGAAHQWPQSLRTAVGIMLGSRFPIALYWGPEFLMLYNDDLLPMVGRNKHPWAMGQPAFEIFSEIRSFIEPLLRQVTETGEPVWMEDLMLPLQRGTAPEEGYFTFSYSAVRDESGGVGGVLCAALETTDKVIEGRRLRLLNALADATQAKTPSEALAVVAGHLAHAQADVPFALLYLTDEAAGVERLAAAASIEMGGELAPMEVSLGDRTLWPAELANGPGGARGAVILSIDRSGGGNPLGFIVLGASPLLSRSVSYDRFHNLLASSISQSVSHAAAYEAERRRAESLAELDRAKTTFVSNVSHEFRTPLTLMLAPIQDMLALPVGAPIDRPSMELLNRNALRLLKLVNTLLEFSRIEAGRIDASYEPVDLAALTTDLASTFRAAIERAGLALVVECPPLAEPVFVDRTMWEKIVLNLLSNALKFTFEGSVAVRLRLDGPNVVLEVADTGTGVAAAELPRMFERFHRIEGVRSRSHEGSGIGLALLHELVTLHGGTVRVASELGVGTTFEVRIPRGSAHLAPERVRGEKALASTAVAADVYVEEALRWSLPGGEDHLPAEVELGSVARRERIVVVDDNADMREYVARLLGERWKVETVGDGLAALASIRRNPPSLVLSDVMMPGLDGFGLVQAIRADEALAAIPVILLSARAGVEETAQGLSSGANDYIAKPFSARELLVRVASSLAAAQAAEALRHHDRVQRENLYRLFMQSPFPICVVRGPQHVIELANPPMLRTWGKDERVLDHALDVAIPELRDQPFLGYLDGVFASGIAHEGQAELARLPIGPAGELEDRYFNFVYAPLRDPDGAIEGTLVTAVDVTDVVRARRSAEAMLEFQERFVGVLGHDLRNPLAALAMASGLLRQQIVPDDKIGRLLTRIESSTRRMSRMVEQILDFTRSRVGGGLAIVPRDMDLGTVLGEIVDEVRTAHPEKGLHLKAFSVPGAWDRDRLEQVFSNLISNAIHHGDPNTPISIELRDEGEHLVIAVHNHGEPIPDGLRSELFDPFRRGERDSRTPKTAGLGLGLYISRELVVAHGGELEVSSTADAGTTFRVRIPRVVPTQRSHP